jgi:hypothetical protein
MKIEMHSGREKIGAASNEPRDKSGTGGGAESLFLLFLLGLLRFWQGWEEGMESRERGRGAGERMGGIWSHPAAAGKGERKVDGMW